MSPKGWIAIGTAAAVGVAVVVAVVLREPFAPEAIEPTSVAPHSIHAVYGADASREVVVVWSTETPMEAELRLDPGAGGVPIRVEPKTITFPTFRYCDRTSGCGGAPCESLARIRVLPNTIVNVPATPVPPVRDVIRGNETLDEERADDNATRVLCTRVEGRGQLHTARVAGLDPGRAYAYRIAYGPQLALLTEAQTFRTAPSAYVGPVVFTAFGDTAPFAHPNGGAVHSENPPTDPTAKREVPEIEPTILPSMSAVSARRAAGELPAFHIHLGDVSYADTGFGVFHEDWWKLWFDEQAPLTGAAVYQPVLGNHDVGEGLQDPSYHLTLFPTGNASTSPEWTIRYGDLVVVGVWSTSEMQVPPRGSAYLERALAENADARWRVVAMHAGPYGTSSEHGSACLTRAALEPVLRRHAVDLVLSGHGHNYERTFPSRDGSATSRDPRAYSQDGETIYVIAGSGGPRGIVPKNPLHGFRSVDGAPVDDCEWIGSDPARAVAPKGERDYMPVNYSAVRHRDYAYVRVAEDADRLSVKAVSVNGTVLDDFAILARPPTAVTSAPPARPRSRSSRRATRGAWSPRRPELPRPRDAARTAARPSARPGSASSAPARAA